MKTKISIKNDPSAVKAIRDYMAEKEEFKKAAQNGDAEEYVKTKANKFVQPV
jgi:cell fate (sporulation/competence/biofilm development) regulator YlbF (YheA/YmcA/DUF963 family)